MKHHLMALKELKPPSDKVPDREQALIKVLCISGFLLASEAHSSSDSKCHSQQWESLTPGEK